MKVKVKAFVVALQTVFFPFLEQEGRCVGMQDK